MAFTRHEHDNVGAVHVSTLPWHHWYFLDPTDCQQSLSHHGHQQPLDTYGSSFYQERLADRYCTRAYSYPSQQQQQQCFALDTVDSAAESQLETAPTHISGFDYHSDTPFPTTLYGQGGTAYSNRPSPILAISLAERPTSRTSSSARPFYHYHGLPRRHRTSEGGNVNDDDVFHNAEHCVISSVVGRPDMPEPAPRPSGPKLKFTPDDDILLVQLKETKDLTWKQIAEFFPGRSSGTLQVRYCTKLKGKEMVWTESLVSHQCG